MPGQLAGWPASVGQPRLVALHYAMHCSGSPSCCPVQHCPTAIASRTHLPCSILGSNPSSSATENQLASLAADARRGDKRIRVRRAGLQCCAGRGDAAGDLEWKKRAQKAVETGSRRVGAHQSVAFNKQAVT